MVSDDAGGLIEAENGGLVIVSDRSLKHLVIPYGLDIERGNVFARVPLASIAATVILVANASKVVADWLYDHARIKRHQDFRPLLAEFLKAKFEVNLHHKVEVSGARKKHKFANVISLPHGRTLLVDPVTPEPASFNSRIVANLDVMAAGNPRTVQRIVYDDEDNWSPENLNLLSVGATAVSFSNSRAIIERIAADAEAA